MPTATVQGFWNPGTVVEQTVTVSLVHGRHIVAKHGPDPEEDDGTSDSG